MSHRWTAFISDTVDSLDLQAFHDRCAKDGPRNQPFHPAMMVKVLLYGSATGVFSSRKIATKLHEDGAFRLLGAGNFPAHRTIRDFRAFHLNVRFADRLRRIENPNASSQAPHPVRTAVLSAP